MSGKEQRREYMHREFFKPTRREILRLMGSVLAGGAAIGGLAAYDYDQKRPGELKKASEQRYKDVFNIATSFINRITYKGLDEDKRVRTILDVFNISFDPIVDQKLKGWLGDKSEDRGYIWGISFSATDRWEEAYENEVVVTRTERYDDPYIVDTRAKFLIEKPIDGLVKATAFPGVEEDEYRGSVFRSRSDRSALDEENLRQIAWVFRYPPQSGWREIRDPRRCFVAGVLVPGSGEYYSYRIDQGMVASVTIGPI